MKPFTKFLAVIILLSIILCFAYYDMIIDYLEQFKPIEDNGVSEDKNPSTDDYDYINQNNTIINGK